MKNALLTCFVLLVSSSVFAQNAIIENESYFIQKANTLENLITKRDSSWYKNCHSELFSVLDSLEMTPKYTISIDIPYNNGYYGDTSHIYAVNNYGKKKDDYLSYIHIKKFSELNCWQWFLLYNIKNMLPAVWRGIYEKQKIVLTDDDWSKIMSTVGFIPDSIYENAEEIEVGAISESEFLKMKSTKITPINIKIDASLKKAEISLCLWNAWSGLSYKSYFLSVKDDNTIEIDNIVSETIIEYDCGLVF